MSKVKSLSESSFLKFFFGFLTVCFLIAAVCMPDRSTIFTGLWNILSSPAKLSTNYFAVGGYGATFLNMALVALIYTLLFVVLKSAANNVSTLGFILTLGFCSWGINILNIIPTILGVALYSLVKKEKLSSLVNAMLFSTGIAPLITDLMLRYPMEEAIGFNLSGVILSLVVGLLIGFFLPAGLAFSPKVHKGMDLYSAALPIGMMAFFLQAVLFKTLGVAIPAAPDAETLQVASKMTVNIFCGVVFGLAILFALLLGCKPRDYWKLLREPALVTSFSGTYGNAVFLMNFGIYGFFILGYYNLIGVAFNGVTFGIIFCMLACCNSGSTPANVWPIMLGYAAASFAASGLSSLVGGTFTLPIGAQTVAVGLCYSSGLSPISQKYGWRYGFAAAVMHYLLVTAVPALHGGYCLYNGGFTAALICIILVPILERFFKTKEERRELRKMKS